MYSTEYMTLGEGEALRFIPVGLKETPFDDSQHNLFTWHRQTQQGDTTSFSSSEEERIHHHGPALFFLPLSLDDSGNYTVR